MTPHAAILWLWGGWVLSWLAAARWTSRTEMVAGWRTELRHRLPMLAGLVLFCVPVRGDEGPMRLWHVGGLGAWICAALVAAGFSFCWWARLHLGKLWSGHITRKADHRVVDTGPYAIVRHPIYTGGLLSVCATAVARGTVWGLAGAAVLVASYWWKATLEERWLSRELGADAYRSYRRRVPMLLPFGPTAR